MITIYNNIYNFLHSMHLDRHWRRKFSLILKFYLLQVLADYRNPFHCIQCKQMTNEACVFCSNRLLGCCYARAKCIFKNDVGCCRLRHFHRIYIISFLATPFFRRCFAELFSSELVVLLQLMLQNDLNSSKCFYIPHGYTPVSCQTFSKKCRICSHFVIPNSVVIYRVVQKLEVGS